MTVLSSHRNLIILWMKILVHGLAILVLQITSMRCQMSLLHKGAPRFEEQHGIDFFLQSLARCCLKQAQNGDFEKDIFYICRLGEYVAQPVCYTVQAHGMLYHLCVFLRTGRVVLASRCAFKV